MEKYHIHICMSPCVVNSRNTWVLDWHQNQRKDNIYFVFWFLNPFKSRGHLCEDLGRDPVSLQTDVFSFLSVMINIPASHETSDYFPQQKRNTGSYKVEDQNNLSAAIVSSYFFSYTFCFCFIFHRVEFILTDSNLLYTNLSILSLSSLTYTFTNLIACIIHILSGI